MPQTYLCCDLDSGASTFITDSTRTINYSCCVRLISYKKSLNPHSSKMVIEADFKGKRALVTGAGSGKSTTSLSSI